MPKLIFILTLFLTCSVIFSQNQEKNYQFRQLSGILIDNTGLPLPGQVIIIKGTSIGTQTDFDGKFCLIVPQDETVFIELLFAFDNLFREIDPTINYIELQVGLKSDKKSKIAFRKWKRAQTRFNSELYFLYNSNDYKLALDNICR